MSQDKDNAPTVPNGYTARFDDNYKHWYFVDLSTKKSSWEAPEGTTWGKKDDVAPPPYNPHENTSKGPSNVQQPAQNASRNSAPQGGGFQQQGYGGGQPQYGGQPPYGGQPYGGPGPQWGGPGPQYGGYPPQGYGYPPQPGYGYPPQGYQQMPPQQMPPQQQRNRFGGAGGMALGAGAGMLGGMMLGNAINSGQEDAYRDGYMDANMDDDYGGGDFDGGDF